MDPLRNFTALSPHLSESSVAAQTRDGSDDATSQQCSADPSAFAGLLRPHSVVTTVRGSNSRGRVGGGGALRLPTPLDGTASQLSQPASQFHDALLEDTQQEEADGKDDDEEEGAVTPPALPSRVVPEDVQRENEAEEATWMTAPRRKAQGGGGFLTSLESRMPKNATRHDAHTDAQDESNVEMASADSSQGAGGDDVAMDVAGDGDEHDQGRFSGPAPTGSEHGDDSTGPFNNRRVVNLVVRGDISGDEVDGDAASNSDTESDYSYRGESMDSIPETQPLEESEDERATDSVNDVMPDTEAFADTIDQDAMEPALVADQAVTPQISLILAKPTDEPTTSMDGSSEHKPQFLKRKEKAKPTLLQDPNAFVGTDDPAFSEVAARIRRDQATEDQTLAELADRIRRERETKLQEVASLAAPKHQRRVLDAIVDTEDQTLEELAIRIRRERESKIQEVASLAVSKQPGSTASQDESQEELTPTQPSKSSPEAAVHVALKKRGKTSHAVVTELTASQERSYEFVDSACRCGETVCVCASGAPPPKPTARPSSAIRNLEFSFAIPESQDSESQLLDSLPDVGALALKTLQAAQSVEQPHTKKRAADASTPLPGLEEIRGDSALEVTPKKARKSKESSPSSVTGTPPARRKRGHTFLSPDAGANPNTPHSRENTPKQASQNAKPLIPLAATAGSSTPSVRKRARILSPVPAAPSTLHSSRSKSLFKNARHFCLTGFAVEGLDNLTKLIEDYGGKVCQEDVLHRKNSGKVVVIATPVSWRKLKFMIAVACGIPVVHPEWIHGCIKSKSVIPFDGYFVPSGCSSITGKFECQPVKSLDIFKGLRFGIPFDVEPSALDSTKRMSSLTAFILRECGAEAVHVDLKPSRDYPVNIVLADEFTKTCDYYARKHGAHVKTLAWVTECVLLQQLLEPDSTDFTPRLPRAADVGQRSEITVPSATVPIGNDVELRLHNGELLLVDLSEDGTIDHFLLFDVCEILSIRLPASSSGGSSSKRKQAGGGGRSVKLEVGILDRHPNSPALRRSHSRVIDLSPDKVKRRVVAVSKADFDAMRYRDETIFYYEEE